MAAKKLDECESVGIQSSYVWIIVMFFIKGISQTAYKKFRKTCFNLDE